MRQQPVLSSLRLDVWLDVSCIFPTRSQAKEACEGGKVDVNGSRAKAHREIHVGDRVSIAGRRGERREILVRGLSDRSIPKAQARELYQDVSLPVAPEVAEARRLDRLLTPRADKGRPDRRDRRERIAWKRS